MKTQAVQDIYILSSTAIYGLFALDSVFVFLHTCELMGCRTKEILLLEYHDHS
jgi:hypothetical protein